MKSLLAALAQRANHFYCFWCDSKFEVEEDRDRHEQVCPMNPHIKIQSKGGDNHDEA